MRECVQVQVGYAKSVSKFIGAQPFVKVGRIGIVELLHELLDSLLLLGRAAQLEQQVLHWEGIFDSATIVFCAGVTMRVACERDAFAFIDVLRDARTRAPPCLNRLGVYKLRWVDQYKSN